MIFFIVFIFDTLYFSKTVPKHGIEIVKRKSRIDFQPGKYSRDNLSVRNFIYLLVQPN